MDKLSVINNNQKSEITTKEIVLLLFFSMVILGSIIVNFLPDKVNLVLEKGGFDYLYRFNNKRYSYSNIFYYLLLHRGILFITLLVLLVTKYKKIILLVFASYIGLAWGTVSSLILMEFGVGGIGYSVFSIFPHYVFYFIGLSNYVDGISNNSDRNVKNIFFKIVFIIFTILTIISGIMVEAWVYHKVFVDF